MRRIALGIGIGLLLAVLPARGHNLPGTVHNQEHAITYAFCGHTFKPCAQGNGAVNVAIGESSSWWWKARCAEARNGQFLGCFQMGLNERRKYGNGAGVWNQARAAYRYFVDSGRDWSPWTCKPWGC